MLPIGGVRIKFSAKVWISSDQWHCDVNVSRSSNKTWVNQKQVRFVDNYLTSKNSEIFLKVFMTISSFHRKVIYMVVQRSRNNFFLQYPLYKSILWADSWLLYHPVCTLVWLYTFLAVKMSYRKEYSAIIHSVDRNRTELLKMDEIFKKWILESNLFSNIDQ
jgi:hypothetical protein